MDFFDFHHHHLGHLGIYNLDLFSVDNPEFFSVGLHPKDIDADFERDLDWVKSRAQESNCLAIGECGLDALVEAEASMQEEIFTQQILLANSLQKPVIIHCVRRHSDLLKFKKIAKVPMIVHGFNKKESLALSLLNAGFFLSFGKSLLENLSLQSVFRECPNNRFFLETDASDIRISEIYEKASILKSMSLSEMQSLIKQNLNLILNNE
ncbi:TatD family hydrolase [Soonwooa sp.]|uniref:TatD family hydrolase n=1 Tax=Soonwooa sp. TaxID=1938592 RepID=UPI0026068E95|nr:TatD family hydrolase [Soonwooa sp.]